MMAVLILCLIASFAIGSYKLATTPEPVFTPAPGAWDTLQWPTAERAPAPARPPTQG